MSCAILEKTNEPVLLALDLLLRVISAMFLFRSNSVKDNRKMVSCRRRSRNRWSPLTVGPRINVVGIPCPIANGVVRRRTNRKSRPLSIPCRRCGRSETRGAPSFAHVFARRVGDKKPWVPAAPCRPTLATGWVSSDDVRRPQPPAAAARCPCPAAESKEDSPWANTSGSPDRLGRWAPAASSTPSLSPASLSGCRASASRRD